ncbi:MAG: hypothetical protein HY774_26485 [Acidobacteria bacterium]|nr:hypothetical protein [Acidobacteriota bacterium]
MTGWKFDTQVFRFYLLGQSDQLLALGITPELFEEALFSDPDVLEQLSQSEDALVDEYVLGKLTQVDRVLFETGYLTTDGRHRKVALAKTLFQSVVPGFSVVAEPSVASVLDPGAIEDEDIERYLLGQMTEAERVQLETVYFEDDALFTRVKLVEDRLMNNYLFYSLSESAEERFTATYLVPPSRYRRVKLTELLLSKASEQLSADPQFCDSIGYLHPLANSPEIEDKKPESPSKSSDT